MLLEWPLAIFNYNSINATHAVIIISADMGCGSDDHGGFGAGVDGNVGKEEENEVEEEEEVEDDDRGDDGE